MNRFNVEYQGRRFTAWSCTRSLVSLEDCSLAQLVVRGYLTPLESYNVNKTWVFDEANTASITLS